MKLIAVTASGFFGFEQNTRFDFVDNRIICVGANGTGKSNILNLVEFFLIHGTGLNIKLHWTQGRSAWEVHKQCAASLHFSLTTAEQEGFAKWRLVSILGLMSTEPNIRTIVANLERQDMEDLSQAFTVAEITPQDANDVAGVEKSPLFRKLIGERSSTKRVKLFWEILEKALLGVYARKKPYDTAVYCASTEPRDLSSVVFQQVLCDNLDREQLVQQLEGSAVSSDIRVLVPCVLTLEDEVQALRAALCPASGQIHSMQHRGLAFCTVATGELWASIEQHLRYGMQKMSHPVISGAEVERDVVDLNLATCAFATPPTLRGYPRVESLVDVRTYISRLVLETEKYMKTRPAGCQMEHIGGITYALRRLLLRSVCILPQDRTFVGDGTYLCLTTHDVEGFVTRLMESSNRDDIRAVSRMQTAMRTMTGQEIRSHRYFESGACVVGMSTAFRHSAGVAEAGLRNVGGGYKELLVVLMAMHGVGADSVLLDSPGFSLHPPQQKALALWISKCLFENTHSQVQHSPVSIVLITNSTEFITEDSLSCLYCFQRVLQSSVKSYTYNTANLQVFAPAVGGLDQIGVPVFDKPVESAIITYVIPPGTEIRCRGTRNAFSELVDGSGFIRLSDVMLICEDSPENEIAIRVKPLVSGTLQIADGLKLLDPTLKRLVFASGVFFFEGQSDYRVIEALKHVASGVSWETVIMHGAGEVSRIVKIVDALGIPYGIVVDYDQIMPTQFSKKHTNEASMSLWRASTIHRLIDEQIDLHRKSAKKEPVIQMSTNSPSRSSAQALLHKSPLAPSFPAANGKRYAAVVKNETNMVIKHNQSVTSLDDLVELLSSFKQDNLFDDGLSEQLQSVTTDLKHYIQSKSALDYIQDQKHTKTANKFSQTKKEVEIIINDSSLHPGIRSALVRKKLRSIGIFTWNADLEGMIFGYGYDLHDKLVVASMPQSIKDFCYEEQELFSGLAYERYINLVGGLTGDRDPNRDDAERICYLVETSASGRLTSRDVSKAYVMAFAARFRSEVGGVHYPFRVIVDRIQKNRNIKVTVIDDYAAYLLSQEKKPLGMAQFSDNESDSDGIITNDSNILEPDLSPKKEIQTAQISDNVGDKKKSFLGVVKNDFDVLNEDLDIIVDTDDAKSDRGDHVNRRGRRHERNDSRSKDRRDNTLSPAISAKFASVPRTDDAVYEDDTKEYLFEWIGPRDVFKEHPQHIFQSAAYWRFVGSVLHGTKERAGMWRNLPWAVLKDVIYCTKNIRVPDNKASSYMSTEEIERYGKATSSAAIHLGLRDLLEFMEDMETRGVVPL